jgi:tankyrase
LKHGADVHARDKGGLVPLHNACSYGHFDVVELLLKYGAIVNVLDLWQFTPLQEAASKGRGDVCSLLLANGANPLIANCHNKSAFDLSPNEDLRKRMDYEFRGCQLLLAAEDGDPSRLKKLISSQLLSFQHRQTLDTPLHKVCMSGSLKRKVALEILLKRGINTNMKNKESMTALMCGVECGHLDVVELLVKHGAELNHQDVNGLTALHWGAKKGHIEICRCLLNNGADTSLLTNQGESIYDMPMEESFKLSLKNEPSLSSEEIEHQLIEASKNADLSMLKQICTSHNVNCRDTKGRLSTPLHFAAGYNRVAIVEYLLNIGADVQAKDKGYICIVPLESNDTYKIFYSEFNCHTV